MEEKVHTHKTTKSKAHIFHAEAINTNACLPVLRYLSTISRCASTPRTSNNWASCSVFCHSLNTMYIQA